MGWNKAGNHVFLLANVYVTKQNRIVCWSNCCATHQRGDQVVWLNWGSSVSVCVCGGGVPCCKMQRPQAQQPESSGSWCPRVRQFVLFPPSARGGRESRVQRYCPFTLHICMPMTFWSCGLIGSWHAVCHHVTEQSSPGARGRCRNRTARAQGGCSAAVLLCFTHTPHAAVCDSSTRQHRLVVVQQPHGPRDSRE